MGLDFTKMHGLGNDFMVVEAVRRRVDLDGDTIRRLADRRTGVGFDQLLLLEPARDPSCDLRYRIFNADGGEVEQCGNGARCVARFAIDKGLARGPVLTLETLRGPVTTEVTRNGQVTVNMGVPELEPARIPFNTAAARGATYPLHIPETGADLEISAVSMGNPHAVLLVDDADAAPVAELGPLIEAHRDFPARVNVGFMEITGPDAIRLRVYERGAGETRACGSGACAAVVAGRLRNLLPDTVTAGLIGGTLSIHWEGEDSPVFMTGPAQAVFDGHLEL